MKSCAAVLLALFACADASADVMPRLLADCGDKDEEECNCVAGCAVLEGLECDGDGAVASSISEIDMKADGFACDSFMCQIYCLNSMDCWDDDDKKGCKTAKEGMKDCDVDCDGGVAAGVTFAVAMLVFGAH